MRINGNTPDKQTPMELFKSLAAFERKRRLADALAENLLYGKVDKSGKPLIEHCRRVFHKCVNLSNEQRLAALLHDVIEEIGNNDEG